jgi:hypothetical protein
MAAKKTSFFFFAFIDEAFFDASIPGKTLQNM